MQIRIFSSFSDSTHAKITAERVFQSDLIPGYKDRFQLTDGDDYTHVLILNVAMPNIEHIPKENVIGLAYEPPYFLGLSQDFVTYAQKYIGKYFIGEKYDLPSPFIEHYSYMWHCSPLDYIPIKNARNIISIIISGKQSAPGHKYRHDIVNSILKTNLPIDIYGNGCKVYQHLRDDRIKGEFTEYEPYTAYDFHIAIENFQTNDYFSEKIVNALLCSAIPIYLGCRNIDHYFPNSSLPLSGNLSEDISLLRVILQNPAKYKKIIDVSSVKTTTNLLLNVENLFLREK